MTIYRDEILCAVDREQWLDAPGGPRRAVSVVMRDQWGDEEPQACVLGAAEARELAFELLSAAELAERIGGRP